MGDWFAMAKDGDLDGVRRAAEADPSMLDLQDAEGKTALMLACRLNQPEVEAFLIRKGAKLDLQDDNGWTALMLACRFDQPEVVQLLISKGAHLDLQLHDGWTALMLACQAPDTDCSPRASAAGLLRCVKLCYAGGADLHKTTNCVHAKTALQVAEGCGLNDTVAFLKFVLSGEVVKVLLEELDMGRATVVAFYDNDFHSLEDCTLLTERDLEAMGVDKIMTRRKAVQRFTQSSSRASKRMSLAKRVSRALSRRAAPSSYAAFLTHDWGADELHRDNHFRVARVNESLKAAGLVTWFDEERLKGNLSQKIAQGIEVSRKVLVFVTLRYMMKLMEEEALDYCRDEFLMAASSHSVGTSRMIPVVMEPRMREQGAWRGPLKLSLGSHMYVDFSTDELMDTNMPALIARVQA